MQNLFKLVFSLLTLLTEHFAVVSGYPYSSIFNRGPPPKQSPRHQQEPIAIGRQDTRVKTITVTCHADYMEITVNADLFSIGIPIDGADLRLGVNAQTGDSCRATASAPDEYSIAAALTDCGTKHWITNNSLIYTNFLIYSPALQSDGLIWMEEAVIPIECHYARRFGLTSDHLQPTWIPFTSTQSVEEALDFSLRLMTSDWLSARASSVYFLGDAINMEASVRLAHHVGLCVFVESCVATVTPESNSVPRYAFIENKGCLIDGQQTGSNSRFMPRIQDDKLQMQLDAFGFHQEDRMELYITCYLTAVPIKDDSEPLCKACSFIDGRWRSAAGDDWVCDGCWSLNGFDQAAGSHLPAFSGRPSNPRMPGHQTQGNKPMESPASWSKIGAKKGWEKEMIVGPLSVLPKRHKIGSLPLPRMGGGVPPFPSSTGDRRPVPHSSLWKNGMNAKMGLYSPFAPSGGDEAILNTEVPPNEKVITIPAGDLGTSPAPPSKEEPTATSPAPPSKEEPTATSPAPPSKEEPTATSPAPPSKEEPTATSPAPPSKEEPTATSPAPPSKEEHTATSPSPPSKEEPTATSPLNEKDTSAPEQSEAGGNKDLKDEENLTTTAPPNKEDLVTTAPSNAQDASIEK